jgi:hypothetical protein
MTKSVFESFRKNEDSGLQMYAEEPPGAMGEADVPMGGAETPETISYVIDQLQKQAEKDEAEGKIEVAKSVRDAIMYLEKAREQMGGGEMECGPSDEMQSGETPVDETCEKCGSKVGAKKTVYKKK